MKKLKKGISLITLIITIVVIIIIAAAIILSIAKTNVIKNANNAVTSQDIATIKDMFSLEIADIVVSEKDTLLLYTDSTYGTQITDNAEIEIDKDGQAQIFYKVNEDKGCIVFARETTSTIEEIEGIEYRYLEQKLPTVSGPSGKIAWSVNSNNALVASITDDGINSGTPPVVEPDEPQVPDEPQEKDLLDVWVYNFDTQGYLTLEEYIGDATSVEVPATYEKDGTTYKVMLASSTYDEENSIYSGPFHGTNVKNNITSVDIAEGVEIQNNNADYLFAECTAIASVNRLPSNVTSAKYALYSTAITQMPELPQTLNTLYATFGKCSNLASVEIPTHITNLDFQTFAYCTSLTSITLPKWVTNIGPNCFIRCTALDNLHYNIPNCSTGYYNASTDTISMVFSGSPLSTVTFGEDVETIPAFFFYSNTAYSFTTITIPDNVKTIGKQAFRGCANIQTLDIGDGVQTILDYAFYQGGMTTIILGEGLTSIGQGAFYLTANVKNVYITKSLAEFNAVSKGANWSTGMGGILTGFSSVKNVVYDYVRP